MARRNSFGTIISVGTPAKRKFAIRWWEGKVRRKVTGFATKKEAADALAKVRVGLGDGTLAQKRKGETTFGDVAQKWLELHSSKLRSHAADRSYYRGHVEPVFGHLPVASVTPTCLLEFRNSLKVKTNRVRRKVDGKVINVDKPLKPHTCNRILGIVRRVLNFAVTQEFLAASPVWGLGRDGLMIQIPKERLARPIIDPADAEDFMMVGRDLFVLQTILGHSTPQLTSDLYGDLSPASVAEPAGRISYPLTREEPAAIAAAGRNVLTSTQMVPAVRLVFSKKSPSDSAKPQ